jgi:hypothetical protein
VFLNQDQGCEDHPPSRWDWCAVTDTSLDNFLGEPDVRVGFRFYNGCGDCRDAEWVIDDAEVVIEAEAGP